MDERRTIRLPAISFRTRLGRIRVALVLSDIDTLLTMAIRSNDASSDIVRAPHPPLTEYYRGEEDRRTWVGEQFNKTAPDYDRMEAILGLGSGPSYRRRTLQRAGLKPGMKVLDVGMGTGLVARQAASIVGDPTYITGVDPSPGMIHSAKLPAGVKVVEGRAEQLPLPSGGFDFLSMGYALRHIRSEEHV